MKPCDYNLSKSKAYQLQKCGFGFSSGQIAAYQAICSSIEIDELTHLVAISYFRAKKECKNFYSVLTNELSYLGVFKNRKNLSCDFDTTDWKDDVKIKQLNNLYTAIGFQLFYEHVKCEIPKSTLQKLLWKSFAKRKNESRISKAQRKQIKNILESGGRIRFSKSSSSVYIENNETKLRISDHSEDAREDFKKTQISCWN